MRDKVLLFKFRRHLRKGSISLIFTLGQCVRLRIKQSGFEHWPRTLCCVLKKDTLLLQCLSLHPGVQTDTGEFNAVGSPVVDRRASQLGQGEIEMFLVTPC